ETVNAADLVGIGLVAVIVLNLDFVAAAQIDAAIAAAWVTELGVQLEIGKVTVGDQIIAGRRIYEHSVPDFPAVFRARGTRFPAGLILAVEKLDRLAPGRRACPLQGRGAAPRPA